MRSVSLLAAIILALLCTIDATGQPQLQTISPNGGERLNAGDTITLTWSGTTKRDTVRLEYSLDSGRTWLKIAARVSDTSYRWRVPDTVAEHCLFRVAQVYTASGSRRTTGQLHYYNPLLMNTLAFSPDGSKISGSWGGNPRGPYVMIGDLVKGEVLQTRPGPPGFIVVDCIRYSPDGSMLATSWSDGMIRLLNATTGDTQKVLSGHKGWVSSVSFSHDGQYLVSASYDGTVRIWKVTTGELVLTISEFSGRVYDAQFDPTDHFMVAGSGDTIKVVDVSNGVVVRAIYASEAVYQVNFSHNGLFIASAHPSTVRIWDAVTGDSLHLMPGLKSIRYRCAFSPDDSRLATIGLMYEDRKLKLWDVSTGELIDTITQWIAPLSDVIFSPDGSSIAATEGAVRTWDLLPTDPSNATWSIVRVAPITVVADTIDFKQVALNETKDSLLWIANSSDHPITFTGMVLSGPDVAMFSLVNGGGAFTLAPGDTSRTLVRFAPTTEKEAHAQLLFMYNSSGSPAVVELKGNGVESTVSVQENAAPELMRTMLKPVRPNPARDAAEIEFYIPASTHTRITVVDERGNAVATVTDGRLEKGWHSVPLDLSSLPSGEYYCRLSTGEGIVSTPFRIVR